MKYSEFNTHVRISNVPYYWVIYRNGIRLKDWTYDIIKDLEVTKIELDTYTFDTPYDGAGINVTVYLEEPMNEIR